MSSSGRRVAAEKQPIPPNSVELKGLMSVPHFLGRCDVVIPMGQIGRLLRNGQFVSDLGPGRHAWTDFNPFSKYVITTIDTQIHLLNTIVYGAIPIQNAPDLHEIMVRVPLSISFRVRDVDTLLHFDDAIAHIKAMVSDQVTTQLSYLPPVDLIADWTWVPRVRDEVQRWLQMTSVARIGLEVLQVLISPPGLETLGQQSAAFQSSSDPNVSGSDSRFESSRDETDRYGDKIKIFVSHSHHDITFCRRLVRELRNAGADVWYDEHDLEPGQLTARIQQALRRSSVFVPILSRQSLGSTWVKAESMWAYNLYRRDEIRTLLPITIEALTQADFDDWLFLEDFARIEAPVFQPYPETEAIRRTLEMLGLAKGSAAYDSDPLTDSQSVHTLIDRGRILYGHGRYTDALVVLMQATHVSPDSTLAWITLGATHQSLAQYEYALRAYQKALTLDPTSISARTGKGLALLELKRYEEAIEAFDNALKIDPDNPDAMYAKSQALRAIKRNDDAYKAEEQARQIDPSVALKNGGITSTDLSEPLGLPIPTHDD